MFLDNFALFLLAFTWLVLFYGVIVIHDIPYEIAKHRGHLRCGTCCAKTSAIG
ncbi:MAG: DUF3302 domain-containing protein [Acidiferrobacteraceae bacterium]|nr:DUF3302 domain-containing protein [Acidiferrobacteraceae bacterium]MBT3640356.1 DUF3302 domain-containing protein [Acidiferrobacteraceae bacterium]MBT3769924.1 DUF3302 domain-containing protein [Acidiferrobacteraceae bacterium]MBT3974172.1 DUF3302 domain-containing protein [Acidiferrobacteraceae bacterium]MBT4396388.1 DUF3302 domain-containing protein [Acidiferrobacteraceae bacterium]